MANRSGVIFVKNIHHLRLVKTIGPTTQTNSVSTRTNRDVPFVARLSIWRASAEIAMLARLEASATGPTPLLFKNYAALLT